MRRILMKSYIKFDHPYFSVTDKNGSFSIPNVPDGTLEIVASGKEKFGSKKSLNSKCDCQTDQMKNFEI